MVLKDIFSKFDRRIALKNKYAQKVTDACSQFTETSKCKPNLIETDDGKEYVNKIFTNFLGQNNFERYSRYTSRGA